MVLAEALVPVLPPPSIGAWRPDRAGRQHSRALVPGARRRPVPA